jgi:hypothetical protein
MRKGQFTDEQILSILKDAEACLGKKKAARKYGVTEVAC